MICTISLLFALFLNTLMAQSDASMTASGQVNKLIFDSVASSPAFVSRTQFVDAWNAAVPYLPKPENVTRLNILHYPLFMNSAVTVGNINNVTQLAMYFSQILYETNGLSIVNVMPCSRFGDSASCASYIAANVNNTGGYCECVDYHGRGKLFIENASDYKAASQALFNSDIIYENPDHVAKYPQVAWATAAWNWATNVGSLIGSSDAFGLTTKFLRPNDCSVSQGQTDAALSAFNIYQQVLSVFDPDRVPNSSGCVPNRS